MRVAVHVFSVPVTCNSSLSREGEVCSGRELFTFYSAGIGLVCALCFNVLSLAGEQKKRCLMQHPQRCVRCLFSPALWDSGQPHCSQRALHRHLRLRPGSDRAAGDEMLCKPHRVCSQQETQRWHLHFFGGGKWLRKQLVCYQEERERFLSFYSKLWFEFARSYMANIPWSQSTFLKSQSSTWINTAGRKLDVLLLRKVF